MSDLISQNINIFLRSCIKAVGHFIFMWMISWKLTLVTVMGFPFIGLVSQLYGDYYKVGRLRPLTQLDFSQLPEMFKFGSTLISPRGNLFGAQHVHMQFFHKQNIDSHWFHTHGTHGKKKSHIKNSAHITLFVLHISQQLNGGWDDYYF